MPCLPRKSKRDAGCPAPCTCRLRSVVRPKLVVGPGVFLVADAHRACVSSRRTMAASTFSRGRPRRGEILLDLRADARQHAAEQQHLAVLRLVAHLAPARMVAVLLAPARIAPDRLQMAVGMAADPDILIGRRDRQLADAGQRFLIGDAAAVGHAIAEAALGAHPRDARPAIGDIAQLRRPRRRLQLLDRGAGERVVRRHRLLARHATGTRLTAPGSVWNRASAPGPPPSSRSTIPGPQPPDAPPPSAPPAARSPATVASPPAQSAG